MSAMTASTPAVASVTSGWLALREPADAAARAADLVDEVQRRLPAGALTVVHDLGCGTGSMKRWLAPRLAGPQHWVMYDRDADLLARAAADPPQLAADGSAVTVQIQQHDITALDHGELAGASLITASALLDMLTISELERIVRACVGAGCPALVTLSVIGRVDITPSDPLDETIAAAFNAHQRRSNGGDRLLGPDAVGAAADLFARQGVDVVVKPSPWRLGAADVELTTEWLTGWIGAACDQQPELTAATRGYLRRRLADATAGSLRVTVHHDDLLARPR
jgi:SAM-dependent methyltransferase